MVNYSLTLESTLASVNTPLNPKNYNLAVSRALKRLIDWAATKVSRHFSRVANLPVRALKHRFYKSVIFDKQQASLWLGLSKIQVDYLGRVRQTKRGVSVRGQHFDGAFVATMKNGHTRTFRRSSKASLPIEYVYKKITTDEDIDAYLASISREIEQKFAKELEYQIGYISGGK